MWWTGWSPRQLISEGAGKLCAGLGKFYEKPAANLQQKTQRGEIMPRNIFYAQSGGVTAVINATACGVIETAHRTRGLVKVNIESVTTNTKR